MLIFACKKDLRNEPRYDEKKKLIPVKKGAAKAKSLFPEEHQHEILKLMQWFLSKLRPHSKHMFEHIVRSLRK